MTSPPAVAAPPFIANPAQDTPAPVSPPKWWRQSHTYVFVVVVLINLILPGSVLIGLVASRIRSLPEWFVLVLLGTGVGQLFLLGVWISLGGLRIYVRIFVAPLLIFTVVMWYLVGLRVVLGVRGPGLDEVGLIMLAATVIGSTAVWMLHAALLPLRWLLGWRIDFDPAYHAHSGHGSMQVGIKHFFGWTIICALPFALARTITVVGPENKAELPLAICIYGAVGVIAGTLVGGPLVLACLTERKFWFRLSAALGWCALVAIVAGLILTALRTGGPGTIPYWIAGLGIGSFAATIAGNLLFLRLFGLKLFSVNPKSRRDRSC